MKDSNDKVQYVYLEKFLKVKEKIIERFKEDSERIDIVESKLQKLDERIKFFAIIDVISILIMVIIIIGFIFTK
jgi:hypothetical protein